ncbi:hypothetical protein [Mycolicibacterium nivoides]|uniref:hypothetical protein n=1 Tax=Mycolicibacterium nivoides TaxID=2487344 RepID=UPI000F5B9053|nr:hypothetical protein [Mycolicibacterium nivoides]
MGIWKTYRTFSTAVQWLLGLSFVLGCVALAVGVRIDVMRPAWWANLSFTQNVAASLVGFLIGVPVALTGLAAFTADREHRIELARVEALSHTTWARFREAISEFCNQNRRDALAETVPELDKSKRAVSELLEANLTKYQTATHPKNEHFPEFGAEYVTTRNAFERNYYKVTRSIGTTSEIELGWSRVLATWTELDGYVKNQRSKVGLPWLIDEIDTDIRNRITGRENPMNEFLRVHEYDAGGAEKTSMGEFLRNINDSGEPNTNDADKFGTWLVLMSVMFSDKHVSDYGKLANAALTDLSGLLSAFQRANDAGWPSAIPTLAGS